MRVSGAQRFPVLFQFTPFHSLTCFSAWLLPFTTLLADTIQSTHRLSTFL